MMKILRYIVVMIVLFIAIQQQQHNHCVLFCFDGTTTTTTTTILVSGHQSWHDCGTNDVYPRMFENHDAAEISMFGRPIRKLTSNDLSTILNGLLHIDDDIDNDISTKSSSSNGSYSSNSSSSSGSKFFFGKPNSRPYQLVNISLVYHLLPQQGIGAEEVRRSPPNNDTTTTTTTTTRTGPIMTNEQRDFATVATNRLFNVYDKTKKQSVQFASFDTYPQTIVHDTFVTRKDCRELSAQDMKSIITTVSDWEYRMHVIVCEFASISGLAALPSAFPVLDPQHNVIRVDYRALACYDDQTGNYLCNNTDSVTNTTKSHTRWWRSRSVVIAHEIGHLFGLLHTFYPLFGCFLSNPLPDIPSQSSLNVVNFGCPGLLPYDKDRDLFQTSTQRDINRGANESTCGSLASSDDICGTTCAACCRADGGSCPTVLPNAQSVSEDNISTPACCVDNTPRDSCRFRRGIDPLNNVMSYAPDYCMYEFTAGQMVRMMLQIRQYKTYIYCNYGTRNDTTICRNVPCRSFATSPNCI